MAKNINTQSTALAKSQEKRFIKSLARIDITLFIVAAIINGLNLPTADSPHLSHQFYIGSPTLFG
jgi:hypothetical protein